VNQLQAAEAALARVLDAVPGLSLTSETARADDGVDGVLEFAGIMGACCLPGQVSSERGDRLAASP
jgi:hypothetical protein